jgi:ActR/RegA family two-component response regulator
MTEAAYRRLAYEIPRVLVVENDSRYRQLYAERLEHWGYRPISAQGYGQALIDDALEMARLFRCHMALVDLRLLDEYDSEERSGLELAKNLLPTRTILVSGFPDLGVVRDALTDQTAVNFVGKWEGMKKLRQVLEKAAPEFCVYRRDLIIEVDPRIQDFNQGFFPDRLEEIPLDEAADVLARLFPTARHLRVDPIETDRRGPKDVPRPRSFILHVSKDGLQPEVVKLARATKIRGEVERYQEFIEGHLVGNFSPPIQHWDALWDIGGTLYPSMGARKVRLFSDYYRDAPVEDIIFSLEQFFGTTWSLLYKNRPYGDDKKTVFKAYSQVWEPKWYHERVIGFKPLTPRETMPDLWNSLNVVEPISWLIEQVGHPERMPGTALAVTHGDLHGDNMLVDDNRNVWVVDFERSGIGPICQDFTELEADILTRLVSLKNEDYWPLYMLGVWVSKSLEIGDLPPAPANLDDSMVKAMKVIRELRRLASECTGEKDARQYYWGLLLNILFRATLLDREAYPVRQMKALMLGGIFCHRLDHWDQPWPPQTWPST